jgi:cytochrome c oxidase subunit 2
MDLFRKLLFLPAAASSFADGVDMLHLFVIAVTMVVSAYVFVMAGWFTVRWRRRSADQLTRPLVATRAREALVVGAVTGTFVLFWVLGFRQYAAMTEPPRDAATVYVEAKQWMWKFSYDDGRSSNDVLTVPVGRPVKLVMSSRDVIHSFYVPAFRVKQDVVPGRDVVAWFVPTKPGSYPIWCAEYCGVSHSQMRGEVVVLAEDAYAAWMKTAGTGPDLVTKGREVAVRRACLACHTVDGQRHVGPTWRGLYGSERVLADGRRVVADEAYLTRSMMEPQADVVAGYRQIMPAYQGALTAAEAGALVELIKSLREPPPPGSGPGVAPPAPDVEADDGGAR